MKKQFLFILTGALFALVITSCKEKQEVQAPPPEIGIVKVLQKDVPIYKDFVGQMYGLKDIPIRARVEGFVDNIYFNEGTVVKKGQLLYAIDPQPFMADVAAQESKLAEAKTLLVNAENELARYKPLAAINAVSKSDLDAAQATRDAAESTVEAAKANLRLSEINLSYTKVYSPLNGVIGKTEAREGEFVGKSPNPVILNTVSRIDTMRVQFFLTEAEYLTIIQEVLARDGSQNETRYRDTYNLELLLSDGSVFPMKGRTDFINRNIDPTTGSMLVEAHFPNTDGILRPGLYAKIRARMEVLEDALLVPQRCIMELQGQYSVFVVDDNNTVQSRQLIVDERVGDLWLVTDGLNPGESIVIDGLQKVGTGMKVNPKLVEFESQTNIQ